MSLELLAGGLLGWGLCPLHRRLGRGLLTRKLPGRLLGTGPAGACSRLPAWRHLRWLAGGCLLNGIRCRLPGHGWRRLLLVASGWLLPSARLLVPCLLAPVLARFVGLVPSHSIRWWTGSTARLTCPDTVDR